jgi:hypothetical protein
VISGDTAMTPLAGRYTNCLSWVSRSPQSDEVCLDGQPGRRHKAPAPVFAAHVHVSFRVGIDGANGEGFSDWQLTQFRNEDNMTRSCVDCFLFWAK